MILKSLFPGEVKVNITNDDIRLKSNLNNTTTIRFTTKSFLYTKLIFSQPHSGPLGDNRGLHQLLPASYNRNRPINITRSDKIILKCDCNEGSAIKGIQQPVLNSFALSSPPGQKIYKEPRMKLLKKINKPVLFHITFYLEVDDHKPVDFNGETISFTCQLIKI